MTFRCGLGLCLAAALAIGVAAQTAAKSPKSGSTVAAAAKRKASSKSTARAKGKAKSRSASARRRPGQLKPTPERYKEIEQALAARGYLGEEPSGKWGTSSVEALKTFQADNQIPPTGRLDSLSLIQLGLGPRQ